MRMLDEIDRKILEMLQADGRASFADVAKACGISASTCFERVRRLEGSGVIKGYSAALDPKKADLALLVYIQVHLEKTTAVAMQEFAVAVAQIPEIMECHLVSGGFDYLLKLRAQDVEHYKTLLSDKIASLPWLRTSNTFVVLDEVVESHRLPLRAIEIRRRNPDE